MIESTIAKYTDMYASKYKLDAIYINRYGFVNKFVDFERYSDKFIKTMQSALEGYFDYTSTYYVDNGKTFAGILCFRKSIDFDRLAQEYIEICKSNSYPGTYYWLNKRIKLLQSSGFMLPKRAFITRETDERLIEFTNANVLVNDFVPKTIDISFDGILSQFDKTVYRIKHEST